MVVGPRLTQFVCVLLGASGVAGGFQKSKPKPVQPKLVYSRDVLPILSDKCFKCHGPDSSSRMADLRLDLSTGAFKNRSGKFAVVPGKPQHSMVVNRILDHDAPMPPTDSGIISRWIAEGAVYTKLWSFEPIPASVTVPKTNSVWPKDDLDKFILARLTQAKLNPSAPADRLRWLRRVTLDLTGLPPTEEEMSAFQADKSKDAYEKVVDQLLGSTHFGERMAVEWLDAARYSDSYGYQSDLLMPTWPYRDWVVKSINDNLPYDKFLTYQLAGDLLPAATQDQRLATAFNRLHRQSNEGGSIALEFKTEYASDRVSTFGTAVLGLTVACAKCHDHKFDPISQKEYFQLFGYFNSIEEYGLLLSTEIVPTPSLLLPTPEQERRLAELKSRRVLARETLKKVAEQAEPRFQKWVHGKVDIPKIPDLTASFNLESYENDKFANALIDSKVIGSKIGLLALVDGHQGKAAQFDGETGLVFRGISAAERWDPFTWSFWVNDPGTNKGPTVLLHRTGGTDVGFCGFDLVLEDGYLTARVMRHWPGNALGIKTTKAIPKNKWSHVAWSYDGSGQAAGLALYLDGKPLPIQVLNDKIWKTIRAYGDHGPSGGDWSFGQRFREAGFKGGKIDNIVFAGRKLSDLEVSQLFDGLSTSNAFGKASANMPLLREYYLSAFDADYRKAEAAVRESEKDVATYENGIQEISVMEEAPKEIPSYVLARGVYDAPRTEANRVQRNVPQVLPALKAQGNNNRLALAQWSTRPDNPLTARVAVNRLWQMMFGIGLVETSENFGVQGSQPTHPELLDHLSRAFITSGWNVKAMLRRMALSATYRQDSARTATNSKIDPENKLYSRGSSHRLSAEMVRDTALAASGLLVDKLGGPPVNPYQPAGIWTENNTMSPGFTQSKGLDLYRRSLYSTWKRTTPVPSMLLFDATSREACVVRRQSTNTPLQALVLLNDVQFVEAARVLAEKVLAVKTSDASRVNVAFERLAGRPASARETEILENTFKEQLTDYRKDVESAKKLIKVGESKANPSLDSAELAAMTVTVQTILNSDAVIWRR